MMERDDSDDDQPGIIGENTDAKSPMRHVIDNDKIVDDYGDAKGFNDEEGDAMGFYDEDRKIHVAE